MRVAMLSSWGARCGIAEYSRLLVEELRSRAEVEIVPATFQQSPKAVYAAMGTALNVGDVAHVQHSYAFFGGMHPLRSGWKALADRVRRPLVVTVHELDGRSTGAYHLPPAVERAYKGRFNRATFLHPAVRRWMVHAVEIREALVEVGAPSERVLYRPLPAPVPPDRLTDAAPLSRKLGLEGRRVLVMLGFLSRRKGYDVAVRALRELPEEYVLVAAGGEHAADRSGSADWLRSEAAACGVADRVRVTGFLSDLELEQAAALADVGLAPFHEMSASASVNFMLSRGRGVVASDLPEMRALGGVVRVPAGDAAALAAAVRQWTSSPDRAASLGEEARRWAAENGYRALAETMLGVYEELLREATPADRA